MNTTRPRIVGSASVGETLKATKGTWLRSPTSYSFKWQDCQPRATGCATIAGASASTLALGAAEVGYRLRVLVKATNSGGSTTARSVATAIVTGEAPAAPSDMEAPAISGSAVEGQMLTVSSGRWSGNPTSYSYRWQLCNKAGEGCSSLAGAAHSTYQLRAADIGGRMRVIVTATNAGGSAEATSAASATVVESGGSAAPVNTMLPTVSGDAVEGSTLSASTGSWSASPTSFSYRWQQCNAAGQGCANISDATGSSYKLPASAVGNTVRVIVTATNAGGSGQATSASSAVVAPLKNEEPKEEKEEEGPITYGTLAHPYAATAITNTEIAPTVELAPHSATIVRQLDGGNGGGTQMQGLFNFTPVIHYASSATPMANMYEYEGGCTARKVQIEPGWWPEPSDEGHMAVLESSGEEVDTWRGAGPKERTKVEGSRSGEYGEQTRAEEESKGCYKPGEWKTVTLFTGANWKTGNAEGGGDDGPHIPEAATTISQKDLESKRYTWGHALAWAGYAYNCKRSELWCGSPKPAISQDGHSTNQEIAVPEGARERLEPSFNCTRDTGTLGREIQYLWEEQWCNTLKKFGMMSTDSSEHTSGVLIRQAQMGSWTAGYVPPWHENGSSGKPIEAVRSSTFLSEAQCTKKGSPPNWLYGTFGLEETGRTLFPSWCVGEGVPVMPPGIVSHLQVIKWPLEKF